ncbi:Stf0 family sulfotransferase [Nonomuraea jabiensis]|uniref:Stf0 family sulfotransferase n=1 Tax=Nonomuraea jabiensis TaxID=882448 RepID=UPI003D70E15B
MAVRSGYILCGTPRTGSTLLCSLLGSTGVLGRPQSYFREPDEATWAQRLGVPVEGARARDYRGFVRAVSDVARTENGVFGVRIMWGSLERVADGLRGAGDETDLATLERAFGPLTLIHLRREDLVAQAVSWSRAEQTGYWQQGDEALRRPHEDIDQMRGLLETIRQHNQAWESWFRSQGVSPHEVTYEQLVDDPGAVVEGIAARLRIAVPPGWQPRSTHRKQADEVNKKWARALRTSLAARPL